MNQSFYADNIYRCYPFCETPQFPIPKQILAGLKIHCGYTSPFRKFPCAYLVSYSSDGEQFVLTFNITDGTISRAVSLDLPNSSAFMDRVTLWNAADLTITAIIGKLDSLPVGTVTGINLRVEPALVVWAQHRGIDTIYIANKERNRIPANFLCSEVSWGEPIVSAKWWLQPESADIEIRGIPFVVSAGFNCSPQISGSSLLLVPSAGAGAGQVSEDYPLGHINGAIEGKGDTEAYLDRYDGLPRYDGIPEFGTVYAFCNAPGPHIKMPSSASILVRPVPQESTIYFDILSIGQLACN